MSSVDEKGTGVGDLELPRGIALSWGIAADPQRGPKRELSIERIVDVAMEIADADGLGAVSMSSLAARLGYTTMSLYRYVSAKDDLIQLMCDEGIGEPPDHEEAGEDWKEGLRRWSGSLAVRYSRHPWLLDIPIDGIPIMPNNLLWLDWGLRILEPARMSANDAVAAVLMLSGLTRWQSMIARSLESSDSAAAEQTVFTELVTPDRYPALSAALAAGGMSDEVADDPFRFALERALDGLERAVGTVDHPVEEVGVEPGQLDYPRDARLKAATRARREAEVRLRDTRQKESDLIAKARRSASG